MKCCVKDKQNKTNSHAFKLRTVSKVCSILCTCLYILYEPISFPVFFFSDKPNTERERDRDRDRDIDLWISRRFWKSQGRTDQTQGQYQTEAYQATLTRTRSSASSPSTSDSVSPLSYRFYSPPVSAISDPYPPYLCVCVSDSLCSHFCFVCVSMFVCVLLSSTVFAIYIITKF